MQENDNSQTPTVEEAQFDCYNPNDTSTYLIAYFLNEKELLINNKPCTKAALCKTIQYDITMNKGVQHFYEPESNFFFMISIVREIEKCYNDRIEVLALSTYGTSYKMLVPDQKEIIDSKISYRMLSE